MPINYGSHTLANSQKTKPFAGSLLPELTSVAGVLQERYDKSLEQDDLITRAVNMAQAAPFSQDQQLLMGLKNEFKGRLQDRSKRGDYENMFRETMMDARTFTDRYQPLAENAKRFQTYKEGINEAVTKGDIKSPDKARRLLSLATQTYQGLQYDPATGQYSNQFQGIPAVKDIDPTEKVDKWMKDLAPTVLGDKVVFTDGVWKRFREGKYTTLGQAEIDSVLAAGMTSDPEYQAWFNQEKQLAGVDYHKVTDADVDQLQDGPYKQALLQARQQGIPARDALKLMEAEKRGSEIQRAMRQYSSKYIRDDRETGSGIIAADEYNLERTKKKLADEELVLSMPILQPETRDVVDGAEDMMVKAREAGTAVQTARQRFDDWKTENQLRPNNKGAWVDAAGNDMTMKYLQQEQVYKQAQQGFQKLQQLDTEARRKTGYGKGSVTPDMIKRAERAADAALSSYAGEVLSDGESKTIRDNAKSEYLRRNSPGYAAYDKDLKERTERGAQLINVQNFNNAPANKQAEALFKSMVLNLDANGLNSGTQGLVWASGDAAGDPLEAGDYKKVVADATFAGWGMDTDGQLKYFYKVGDVKQNAKGKLTGEQALVKMPALPGTVDVLLKHKQVTPAQLALGQEISKTTNTPSGKGYIKVGNEQIFVERISKSDLNSGKEVSGGYNLRIPSTDGTSVVVPASSQGEAINIITNIIQRAQAKQK